MHEAPTRIQERARSFLGFSVAAVLRDGVVDRLGVIGFQFDRDNGDAVDEQHEVDFAPVAFFEVDLLEHPQAVRLGFFYGICFRRVVGKESRHIGKGDGSTIGLCERESVPQCAEQPTVNFLRDAVEARFPIELFREPPEQPALSRFSLYFAYVSGNRALVFARVLRGKPVVHILRE